MRADPPATNLVQRGTLVAEALAGSWRRSPSPPELSAAQLAQVVPLLLAHGEAALVWRRLQGSRLARSSAARRLRDEQRNTAIAATQLEWRLLRAVCLLRAVDIEPILIKGWSIARHYPEPGLRPCGDMDLCVRPDQLPAAVEVLTRHPETAALVDLHRGVPDLADRPWDEIQRRTRLAPLGPNWVRVLGAEDQLRLLCLHLVRHAGIRPLWLCDVAASLETLSADFQWDYFLAGNARLSNWVRCVCRLARELLGANVNRADCRAGAPRWFRETVLWHWGRGPDSAAGTDTLGSLQHDWLNPIKAAYRLRLDPCGPTSAPLMLFLGIAGRCVLGAPRLRRLLRRLLRPVPIRPFCLHQDSNF